MSDPLAIYLHDHLGGANFAVELLEKWSRDEESSGLAAWALRLRGDIERDRDALVQVVARIGEESRTAKEAAGWFAEKLSRSKLAGQSPEFAHFEGLEILALGILGKLSLWQTLELLAPHHPGLAGFDYTELSRRAQTQHEAVETRRRTCARLAFMPAVSES